MKDYRKPKTINHDYETIMGDYVVVPKADKVDRFVRRAVLILFGLLIGFYLWG